ncbi:exonuclease V subunit alpha, partial [Klebsiella pneumoniae]
DIALHPLSTTEEYEAMLGAAQQGYERYLQLRRERAEPQAMLAAFTISRFIPSARPKSTKPCSARLSRAMSATCSCAA